MFFPQKSGTDTLVLVRPRSPKAEQVSVSSLTYEERIAPIKQHEDERKGDDEALFEWKDMPDGGGYLKMPTWALYDSRWNWKQWLNTHLDEAAGRNAPFLILDLCGNEGGDDVGNEILPHLINAPITLSSMRRLTRYRTFLRTQSGTLALARIVWSWPGCRPASLRSTVAVCGDAVMFIRTSTGVGVRGCGADEAEDVGGYRDL